MSAAGKPLSAGELRRMAQESLGRAERMQLSVPCWMASARRWRDKFGDRAQAAASVRCARMAQRDALLARALAASFIETADLVEQFAAVRA